MSENESIKETNVENQLESKVETKNTLESLEILDNQKSEEKVTTLESKDDQKTEDTNNAVEKNEECLDVKEEIKRNPVNEEKSQETKTNETIEIKDEIPKEEKKEKIEIPKSEIPSTPTKLETPKIIETPKSPSTPSGKKPNLKQIFSLQLTILEKNIKESLAEFSNSRKWVILQYNEQGQLEVGDVGDDENVSSFKDKLQDDQISYVVLKRRIDEAVEKVLLIFWAGKQISSIQRAKFIQHKTVVTEFLSKIFQLCGEYYPENRDALNEDKVKQKVIGQSGSVLSTDKNLDKSPDKSPDSSPISRPYTTRSKSFMVTDSPYTRSPKSPQQIRILQTETIIIKNEEEANLKLKELNNISGDVDWIKFGYDGKNINNQLSMQASGQGTAKDLVEILPDTEVSFVIIKAFVARKAQGVASQQKINIVTWIGNKVKASQRASAGSHGALLKTTVSKILHVSGEIKLDNSSDLTNEKIFGNEVLEKQDGLSKIQKTETKKEEVEVDKNLLDFEQFKQSDSQNSWILISDDSLNVQEKGSDFEGITEKLPPCASYLIFKFLKEKPKEEIKTEEKKEEKKEEIKESPKEELLKEETKTEEKKEISSEEVEKKPMENIIDIPVVEEEGIDEEEEEKPEEIKKEVTTSEKTEEKTVETNVNTTEEKKEPPVETPKEDPLVKEIPAQKEVSYFLISMISDSQVSKNREKVLSLITKNFTIVGEILINLRENLTLSYIQDQIEKKEHKEIEIIKPKEYVDPRLKSKSFILKKNVDQDQDLSFKNESEVANTLRELINDRSETNYIVFGLKNGSMEILSSGKNGLEGIKEHMEPKEVRYAIYKIIGSTSYGGSLKVVLITWVGPETGIAQKAKSATHRTFIGNYTKRFMALAGEYPLLNLEDLADEKILQKLNSSVSDLSTKIEISQNRKFGGKDCSLSFVDDKQIDQDYEELKGQDLKVKWLLFAYDNDDLNKLNIIAKGTGGVSAFKPLMKDDQVYYVLMRLTFMEYYDIAKAILITVVGTQVPHFKKALSSGHRYLLYQFSKTKISLAGEYQPDSLEDMTDRDLAAKLTGSSEDSVKEENSQRQEAPKQIGSKFEIKDVHSFTGKKMEYDFTGKDEMKTQLLLLKDPSNNLEYLKFSIEGKEFRDLKFIESGTNALTEEWKEAHLKPNETLLFIISLTFSEVGYGKMTKNAFIQWTGTEIKALRRSKSSEIRHSLFVFVNSILNISTEIQATLSEHVSREILLSRFTGSNIRGKEMEIDEKLEKFKDFGKKKIDLQFENIEKIHEAIDELVSLETSKTNWVLIRYCKDSFDKMEFSEKGEGGIDELKQKLEDNEVGFCALRIMHSFGYVKDMEGMAKPYYGLVQWQGHKVTVLEKAVCSHHFNFFAKTVRKKIEKSKNVISGGHLHAEKQEEFTLEELKKTMRLFD